MPELCTMFVRKYFPDVLRGTALPMTPTSPVFYVCANLLMSTNALPLSHTANRQI